MSEDAEDDYFDRLQESAPSDAFDASDALGHSITSALPGELSEDEYNNLQAASESDTFAAENELVWQELLRSQAVEGVSSVDSVLSAVHGMSAMLMLKQYLSSYLPWSAKLFGLIRHRMTKSSPTEEAEDRFLCDSILHPSFVMRVQTVTNSGSCEVALFAPQDLSPLHWKSIVQYFIRNRLLSIKLSGWDSLLAERLKSLLLSHGACVSNDISCVIVSLLDPFRQLVAFRELESLPEGYSFCELM